MDEWVKNSVPKYRDAIALLETPASRPLNKENSKEFAIFENQYKVKESLNSLLEELDGIEDSSNDDFLFRKKLYKSLFNYYLGVISVETEELSAGETYLTKSLAHLEGDESKQECCILAISIQNQLGILWSGRGEHLKACEYLTAAADIYKNYTLLQAIPPVPLIELFGFNSITDSSTCTYDKLDAGFGKCHVLTLYYLAQVYKHLDKAEESAIHCHKTLKWQIENGEFDQLEWALNCAALSQFFVCRDNFVVARYLLGCASYVLSRVEVEKCDTETYKHTKADIARCWASFGLSLLSSSSDRQSWAVEDENTEVDLLAESFANICKTDDYILVKDDISAFENRMPVERADDYDKAKPIFLSIQSCLSEAKEFYTLNEYASDYVNIIQDISKLYKSLTSFEYDKERQCKMHKRRADLLEETLKSLSIQYWLAVVRQLQFELGELYNEMMDLKYMLQDNDVVSGHAAKKINTLLLKSMTHFFSFINTFKQAEKLPDTYPEDYVRPALLAHFYIARLYSKIISSEPQKCIENLELSKKYYDYIAGYVVKHPEQQECIEEELKLVHELQELLPQKIQRIVSTTLH